jgi:hypothetical protein
MKKQQQISVVDVKVKAITVKRRPKKKGKK